MISRRQIKNIIELFIEWNGKAKPIRNANLDSAVDFISNSLQEEPVNEKKCMFTKDNYTDEDRKILCEDCKEKCEYSKEEKPVSEELEEELARWMKEHFDKDMSRYSGCYLTNDSLTELANHFAKWQEKKDEIELIFPKVRENKPSDISEFLDRLTTVEQEFLWEHIEKVKKLEREDVKQQMLQKACEWLDRNAAKYLITDTIHGVKMTGLHASMTEDFKKYMED